MLELNTSVKYIITFTFTQQTAIIKSNRIDNKGAALSKRKFERNNKVTGSENESMV